MFEYNWYRKDGYNCDYKYQPMRPEDISLFYDIPLIVYERIKKCRSIKTIKIQMIGLHRKKTSLVKMPNMSSKQFADWNDYTNYRIEQGKQIQKACVKAWPLKEPFAYEAFFDIVKLNMPQQLENFIPDWTAAQNAATVALRTETDDIDALFISLYNEIIASSLYAFRHKYKQRHISVTDRILDMKDIPEDVKRFILRVSDVRIEREIGNDNKDTFDFVRIRISIPTKDTFPNRKDFIKRNMQWIAAVAINYLKSLKRFTRFGIPVTCLAIKNAVITSSNELEFLFELKDRLNQMG